MAWWLQKWDALRNSLWFFPTVALIIAVTLSNVMVAIDHLVDVPKIDILSTLVTTESAARATLGSLAGALITVTGVVFSVTMLTLAQTSSQFGSRLLRSFLNHNVSQLTLAVFLGTSLYCFDVLRTVRSQADESVFVPHLSVTVGMGLGLLSLIVFVSFIHHVAQSIQVENVVQSVACDLDSAIDRLFPEQIGKDSAEFESLKDDDQSIDFENGFEVKSSSVGYLQGIDGDLLLSIAVEHDQRINVLAAPGDFVIEGTPLARISPRPVDEQCQKEIRTCFLTGVRRTPRQDVNCAVRELAEVAVRALSPGINDPHTASICIHYLHSSLDRLLQRDLPDESRLDSDGVLRLTASRRNFAEILEEAFGEILFYGRESYVILSQLATCLVGLHHNARRDDDRETLVAFSDLIRNSANRNLDEPIHLAQVESRLNQLERVQRCHSVPAE